ncbi:MAG TPA: M56 family metallopeptidase [Streptosporangiaceae bacterium]|nr:M56 family metallopeptidase [Streptosporangiaceae bacterium]
MIAAGALFAYAIVVACCVSPLLARLTGRGASARFGLAGWLTAMVSAGFSGLFGAYLVMARAVADWVPLTQAVCRSVAGSACSPPVYRSMLYEAGVTALAIIVMIAGLAALWRYCRRVQRAQRRTRAHAEAALLAGRALPGGRGTVVLDDPRPAAYCVAGRPAAIVITSSALAVLDQPQLAAVLAHERAHLHGRHHLLATVTKGLTAAFPGVPLFTRGAAEVARLAEMAADDDATRSAGRPALVTALLAIATGAPVPGLAAAACAVPDRVERLLNPPGRAAIAASRLTLATVSAVLILLPAALAMISA